MDHQVKPSKEPKQKTPKGYEIPVPKREDFFHNLKKAANANPPPKRPAKAKD
jgi:hypothetical protein